MGTRIRDIRTEIILGLLLILVGCGSKKNKPQPESPLYLIETAEYCDYDSAGRVIYLKSPQQLQEIGTKFKDARGDSWEKVYNILGHPVNQSYTSPKIKIQDGDRYDITLHQHTPGSKIITVSSAVKLDSLELVMCRVKEVLIISDTKKVIKYTDLNPLIDSTSQDPEGLYTVFLKDSSISDDYNVVFECGSYRVLIPWFELGERK